MGLGPRSPPPPTPVHVPPPPGVLAGSASSVIYEAATRHIAGCSFWGPPRGLLQQMGWMWTEDTTPTPAPSLPVGDARSAGGWPMASRVGNF